MRIDCLPCVVIKIGRFVQPGSTGERKLNAKELADVQDVRSNIVEWVYIGLRSKRNDVAVVELFIVLDGFCRQMKVAFDVYRVGF